MRLSLPPMKPSKNDFLNKDLNKELNLFGGLFFLILGALAHLAGLSGWGALPLKTKKEKKKSAFSYLVLAFFFGRGN